VRTMKLQSNVIGDANPVGLEEYRHWLSRVWAPRGLMALVVGINPNSATETDDDGMSSFLTRLLRSLDGEYASRGFILVNCCNIRHRDPKKLKDLDSPCSDSNINTIQAMLLKCDFVVASWGTTDYGPKVTKIRKQVEDLVRQSGKKAICFSPEGLPIYCSQKSANTKDGRWSKTPVAFRN
jgi:hypothetical protein